jgi:phage repressor protein C with HTH and peptisase S24 domain
VVKHQGEWLKSSIAFTGLSVTAFSQKSGISRDAFYKWFVQSTLQIRPDMLITIFKTAAYPARLWSDHLFSNEKSAFPESDPFKRLSRKLEIERLINRAVRFQTEQSASKVDQNVDRLTERRFFQIPRFDLVISSGGWADAIGIGETHDPLSIDQGLFRIRLAGDSMAPDFPDGCVVEFCCIRPSSPEIRVGDCYYVHRSDDMATFKRLKSMGRVSLTLVAINDEKYPRPLTVKRDEVVRIAVAVAIIKVI